MRIRYHCKIYHNLDTILMDKKFKSLQEIAHELEMPYQFVSDLSSRKSKKDYQKFKFYPTIDIIKI